MRKPTLIATGGSLIALFLGASAVGQSVPVTYKSDPGPAHPSNLRTASQTPAVVRPNARITAMPAVIRGSAAPLLAASYSPPVTSERTISGLASRQTVLVQPGDTVYAIARRTGVSPAKIIAANALPAPYKLEVGQTLRLPGDDAAGDRMAALAERAPSRPVETVIPQPAAVATSAPAIVEIASAPTGPTPTPAVARISTAPFSAVPAAQSAAPSARTHTVEQGDTMYSISRRYNVDLATLAEANGIDGSYAISLNQVLVIPGVSAPAPLPSAPRVAERPAPAITPSAAPSPVEVAIRKTTDLNEQDILINRAPGTRFSWPLKGAVVNTFGTTSDGLRNDGINIAAPVGAPVRAAADGEVIYTGSELAGYGNLLLVRHDDNWVSAYAHTDSILVSKGDQVRQGQIVAKVGRSGSVERPQLHFELRHELKPRDPLAALEGEDPLAATAQ